MVAKVGNKIFNAEIGLSFIKVRFLKFPQNL